MPIPNSTDKLTPNADEAPSPTKVALAAAARIGDVPDIVLERLQTQVERLNRARAIVKVARSSLERGHCQDVYDEVETLVAAEELLSDITHAIDPVTVTARESHPEEVAHG